MVFRIPSLKIAHESNGEKAKNKFLDVISDFVIDWQWPTDLLLCDTKEIQILRHIFENIPFARMLTTIPPVNFRSFGRECRKFMEIF